ncbi:MAG TPA: efflux RND transporter permease subunit, partial [Nannocystis exedens]|nr:efflux RND transporter permease subunit [Nannocystis exedens]
NAIVLINTVNHRRGRGDSVREALERAGSLRLRPILMTTATTILGLVPMAIGLGDGASLRQPLAITVIGGLALATLLTLLVIPCVYSLLPGRRRDAWTEVPLDNDDFFEDSNHPEFSNHVGPEHASPAERPTPAEHSAPAGRALPASPASLTEHEVHPVHSKETSDDE